ncbi:MAG: hypothetical protein RR058_01150 [Oscillospiraceae bacterium]
MDEFNNNGKTVLLEQSLNKPEQDVKDPELKNAKERLYDKVHLSVRQLNTIITVLVVILMLVLLVGIIKGNS